MCYTTQGRHLQDKSIKQHVWQPITRDIMVLWSFIVYTVTMTIINIMNNITYKINKMKDG